MHPDTTTLARFWAKVDQSGDCWLWTACRNKGGYGSFAAVARKGHAHTVLAHRFSWAIHNGPIPDGLDVLHRCDTPACVNPAHLFLGTDVENVADKFNKGRQADVRGEGNGRAILAAEDVQAIRQRHKAGESYRVLGIAYGVTKIAIAKIVRRENWAHIS